MKGERLIRLTWQGAATYVDPGLVTAITWRPVGSDGLPAASLVRLRAEDPVQVIECDEGPDEVARRVMAGLGRVTMDDIRDAEATFVTDVVHILRNGSVLMVEGDPRTAVENALHEAVLKLTRVATKFAAIAEGKEPK